MLKENWSQNSCKFLLFIFNYYNTLNNARYVFSSQTIFSRQKSKAFTAYLVLMRRLEKVVSAVLTEVYDVHTAVKRGARAQFPPKIFAFKPEVKTVAEKLSFKLHIWPGHLVMDILKSSQLVIFSHSTIFITFSYRSLAGFLFKLLRSSRRRKPEVALDFCVWPLCVRRMIWGRK